MTEKITREETRFTTRFTTFANNIDENSPNFQTAIDSGMSPAYAIYDDKGVATDIVPFSGSGAFFRNDKNAFIPIEEAGVDFLTGYSWTVELPARLGDDQTGDKYFQKFRNVADFLSSGRSQTVVFRDDEVPIEDYVLNIDLHRNYESIDTLNIYNNLVNGLPTQESDTGVVFGKLIANQKVTDKNGNVVKIPLSNVPVGIFQPSEEFPTITSTDSNGNRIQMNFLNTESEIPSEFEYQLANTPNIQSRSAEFDAPFLLNSEAFENIPEHYKIISKTNENGEFILYNVPTGTQVLFFEVDLLKQGLTKEEVALNFFPYTSVSNPNVDNIPHLFFRQFPIDVVPAWGNLQTGYTETNINVNLDLRKWATYFFPPVSIEGQDLEELQSPPQPQAAKIKLSIRNMATPNFGGIVLENLPTVSLVEVEDPIDRNLKQELEWRNELIQSKAIAEFRRDDFSILKLPGNIYDSNILSTSEQKKVEFAEDLGIEYSPRRGMWFSGYQFKFATNLNETWFRTTGFDRISTPSISRIFLQPSDLGKAHATLIRRIRPDVDAAFSLDIGVKTWYFSNGINEFDQDTLDLIATQPILTDLTQSVVSYIAEIRPDINTLFAGDADSIKNWYIDSGIKELTDNQLFKIREIVATETGFSRDHFHLNRGDLSPEPNDISINRINSFPYERQWDAQYPDKVKIPKIPSILNPNWTGVDQGGSQTTPKYLDGDLFGVEDESTETGGWGLQVKTDTIPERLFANKFAKRATKNFLYKYEKGVSNTQKYANGYQPSADPDTLSSVENGEKYQRVECGNAYFMRIEGWPDIRHDQDKDYIRRDLSYGGNSPVQGANLQDDLDITVKAGVSSPKQEGGIEIFRIVNPDPDNVLSPDPQIVPSFIEINTDRIFRRRDRDNNRLRVGYAENARNGSGRSTYFYPHIPDTRNRLFTRFTIQIKNVGTTSVQDPFVAGIDLPPQESSERTVTLFGTTVEENVSFLFNNIAGRDRLANIKIKLDGNDDFDPTEFYFRRARYQITFKDFSGEGGDSNFSPNSHVLNVDVPSQIDAPFPYWLNHKIHDVETNISTGKNRSCTDNWKSERPVSVSGIIMGAGSGKENDRGLFLSTFRLPFSCDEDKRINENIFTEDLKLIGWRFD